MKREKPDISEKNNNLKYTTMDNELKDWLQGWFERFMGRFDRMDGNLHDLSGRYNFLNGERLLDNQDICQLLHVSKRTLQRYRSSGELPF